MRLLPFCILLIAVSAFGAAKNIPEMTKTKLGMVVTCQPLAGEVGVEILRKGGNAAEAFIATTLAEYVTAYGYTSLSGPLNLLYYDSKSKTSRYLNAGLNTVSDPAGQWSDANPAIGKSYVIGGAGRGLESLFQQFGSKKFKFSDLTAPASKLARNGFPVYTGYAGTIKDRAPLFKSSAAWNSLFRKSDGTLLTIKDTLIQRDLADTLDRYGKEGADFIFKGQFAQDLVSAIQAQGGKLSLLDLARYEVYWNDPLEVRYRDFTIQTSSYRSYGGLELLLDLKTIENFKNIAVSPHFSADESNFNLILRTYLFSKYQILPLMRFSNRIDDLAQMKGLLNGSLPTDIWKKVSDPSVPIPFPSDIGSHSCNTIVIDRAGNIATGTHTINSYPWGDYGLFVDGVSLNSAHSVALDAPPDSRALDGLNPTLVFKNERPVLAAGFFSSALHPAGFQILMNLLDYEMPPDESLRLPRFGAVISYAPLTILLDVRYPAGWISDLTKNGVKVSQPSGFIDTGMGMVIQIDPKTGLRYGSPSDLLPHAVAVAE